MQPFDIVAYTYRADNYCPQCIVDEVLDRNAGTTEDALNILASGLGVDYANERSYDSDDFPKVVFRDAADDYAQTHDGDTLKCARCGNAVVSVVRSVRTVETA